MNSELEPKLTLKLSNYYVNLPNQSKLFPYLIVLFPGMLLHIVNWNARSCRYPSSLDCHSLSHVGGVSDDQHHGLHSTLLPCYLDIRVRVYCSLDYIVQDTIAVSLSWNVLLSVLSELLYGLQDSFPMCLSSSHFPQAPNGAQSPQGTPQTSLHTLRTNC